MAKTKRPVSVSFTTSQWASLLDLLGLDGEPTANAVLTKVKGLADSASATLHFTSSDRVEEEPKTETALALSTDDKTTTDAANEHDLKTLLDKLDSGGPRRTSPEFSERERLTRETLSDAALQKDAEKRCEPVQW